MVTTVPDCSSAIDAASRMLARASIYMPHLEFEGLVIWVRSIPETEGSYLVVLIYSHESIDIVAFEFDSEYTDEWTKFTAEEVMNY